MLRFEAVACLRQAACMMGSSPSLLPKSLHPESFLLKMITFANSLLTPPTPFLVAQTRKISAPAKSFLPIKAASAGPDESRVPSGSSKSPLTAVLEIPRTLWRQTMQPLGDFGFGKRSIWEGGVGLFMVSGAALFALTIVWLRGVQLRSRFRKYQVVFEFSQACGICVGTPVRIRGVTVGSVVRVDSSWRSIDAVAEVELEMDKVHAQMTLQPLSLVEQTYTYFPIEMSIVSKQPTNYFCKTLTVSDTSTHGGLFVPRRDFTQQPPAQELIPRDLS